MDYYALLREPLVAMEQVYGALAMSMPDSVQRQLGVWVEDNPAGKRSAHSYRLQDFGLERNTVEDVFADYRAAFDIPVEDTSGFS